VINADGTTQRQLTNFCCGAEAVGGQWSPDGTKIAFTFDQQSRYATYEIYVMNADRPGFLQLTNNGVLDAAPFWRPRGP
jgi:Tol biopolymer transport system component